MKHLVVPTDFSDNATTALQVALTLARRFGAKMTLLHTYKVIQRTGSFISLHDIIVEERELEMRDFMRCIPKTDRQTLTIDYKIVEGDAVPTIARFAHSTDADLVVMGTKGASGLKEIFLGSVTGGVLQKLKKPLLAVPQDYVWKNPSTFVWAVDRYSLPDSEVVAPLRELAQTFGAHVQIFHLSSPHEEDVPDYEPAGMLLGESPFSVHYAVTGKDIKLAINDFIEQNQADLLCMIKHRRWLLDDIFHNSLTRREVFDCPVPLLVLRD